jgi:hypothetical protein
MAIGSVTLLAVCFAFYGIQLRRMQRHETAIASLRNAGAMLLLVSPDGQYLDYDSTDGTFRSVLFGQPQVCVPIVSFADQRFTTQVIRAHVPSLRDLIPTKGDWNPADPPYVALQIAGNPNVSIDFVTEVQPRLPNCQFLRYFPVPNTSHQVIANGMRPDAVRAAITELVAADDQSGPNCSRYLTAEGRELWVYYTDDFGLGTFGVEFDKNKVVTDVWYGNGLPTDRQMTPLYGISSAP